MTTQKNCKKSKLSLNNVTSVLQEKCNSFFSFFEYFLYQKIMQLFLHKEDFENPLAFLDLLKLSSKI